MKSANIIKNAEIDETDRFIAENGREVTAYYINVDIEEGRQLFNDITGEDIDECFEEYIEEGEGDEASELSGCNISLELYTDTEEVRCFTISPTAEYDDEFTDFDTFDIDDEDILEVMLKKVRNA